MVVFFCFMLLAVAMQGVFTLFEMASVSFNKIRLQYYVHSGKRQAVLLHHLLQRPSRLFGTTLIGINVALQLGSECARKFYESIHIDPSFAPCSQFLLVIIFAELSPLFAARRYPEQAAMALAPWMSALARLLTPVIWAFDAISRLFQWMMHQSTSSHSFFSREEVRLAFEEKEEGEEEFTQVAREIFQLKNWTVSQLMIPLSRVQKVPSSATLAEIRHSLETHYAPYCFLYRQQPQNIIGMVQVRKLLCAEEEKKIGEYAQSPWFVTHDTSVLQILQQFRKNSQNVAVILDPSGQSCGILSLDDVVSQIFGAEGKVLSPPSLEAPSFYVERTLSGEMEVTFFNREFSADLPHSSEETLSDLIVASLDHPPAKGETVRLGSYLFTVLEPSLRGVKTVIVQSGGGMNMRPLA